MTPEEKSKIKETLLLESDGNRYGIIRSTVDRKKEGISF